MSAHDHAHEPVQHFAPEIEKELRAEDSAAWHGIVKILMGIVIIGLMLAVGCLILTG